MVGIGLDEPDLAIPEICEEPCILDGVEFAGPENLGGIDFCSDVNPLVMQIGLLRVAHHDQMFAWCLKKSLPNGRATGISLAGPLQLVADVARDGDTNLGCEKL